MSRESIVFCFGLLVFLVPFLGVPAMWKEWFLIFAGALLMVVGFTLRRRSFLRSIEEVGGERRANAFSETTNSRVEEVTEEPMRQYVAEQV